MRRLPQVWIEMKPLKNANFPSSEVCLAAVNSQARELISALRGRNIEVLEILPAPAINDGTAAHADLHVLHTGGSGLLLSAEQGKSSEYLKSLGFDVKILTEPLGGNYPSDVLLNAAVVGDFVFANPKTVCPNVDFSGKTLIPVRQGYTKCSVCPVAERAIITDDPGICRAALKNGFDVLLVEKGDVRLSGRDYGFIGGCCGLVSRTEMIFNGSLSSHRNAGEIVDFLERYSVGAVSCGAYPLTDVGGIIPLCDNT